MILWGDLVLDLSCKCKNGSLLKFYRMSVREEGHLTKTVSDVIKLGSQIILFFSPLLFSIVAL